MYIPNILRPYWMLRVASVLLKLASVVLLLLFCGQLFQLLTVRTNGLSGGLSGSVSGDTFVSTNALIDFVVRSVALVVGTYAGGQLIDLFMSIELSLKTLAGRRRQSEATPNRTE